jgi:hypothetical protein
MRLNNGLSDIQKTLEKIKNLQDERTESLKNILNVHKSLQFTSLDIEIQEMTQEYKNSQINIEDEFEIFFNVYEKNKFYSKRLDSNIIETLKKYSTEVSGLLEIYERKDKIIDNLSRLKYLQNGNILFYI